MKFPTRDEVNRIKKKYKKGTRVELIKMDDVQAPAVGTRGTVRGVDSIGSVMVDWDNGSSLHALYRIDKIAIVEDEQ